MPTTRSSTSGNSYHLFQLPNLCAPEPEFGIGYSTIENEMSMGYRSSSLLGLNTGVRTFKLTLPTISAYGSNFTDPYGNSVARHIYLRNLFKYNQTTGIPFVYQHPDTSQYYLVDFAQAELEMQRIKGAVIYSTNVELVQRRINGETVFDLSGYVSRTGGIAHANETGHSSPNWTQTSDGSNAFTAGGTVTFGSNTQKGFNTVSLNGTSGYLSAGWSGATYDIILAMKVRSTTFPGNNGLFARSTSADLIKGTSGGTKWQNPSITSLQYWLNGDSYAVTDMQAPMNTFGVVHFRTTDPNYFDLSTSPILGRSISSSFGAYNIGEAVIAYGGPIPLGDACEIVEHLVNKWV